MVKVPADEAMFVKEKVTVWDAECASYVGQWTRAHQSAHFYYVI